jgi:hypothetical protein
MIEPVPATERASAASISATQRRVRTRRAHPGRRTRGAIGDPCLAHREGLGRWIGTAIPRARQPRVKGRRRSLASVRRCGIQARRA